MPPTERALQIIDTRVLSPSVRSLVLAPSDGAGPLSFVAGQWLHLHVELGEGSERHIEKRAYSIASDPAEPFVELAVTHVVTGRVSPLLHALTPGAALRCDGPHGFFTRDATLGAAPLLLVGTGTGLAPLRSMLFELLREPDHVPVVLLFGVRTQADILWREELEAWAARDPDFRLEVTLSRPDPAWQGRAGYVQAHVGELARALGAPHVFVCGLSRMVSEVRALCKAELGYDRKRIHSERYD